jgi:hypothetical protein
MGLLSVFQVHWAWGVLKGERSRDVTREQSALGCSLLHLAIPRGEYTYQLDPPVTHELLNQANRNERFHAKLVVVSGC